MEPALTVPELVVNLHVTERCDYACSYCFGKWGLGSTTEVFQDPELSVALVSDVFAALVESTGGSRRIRFNFAGGEPALLRSLPTIVEHCRGIGARTSIVTNGLALRRLDAEWMVRNLDIVGISVDSVSERTNLAIGRATRSGRPFRLDDVAPAVRRLRAGGHRCVKVNTVVSRANVDEDFSGALRDLSPDRWKVMQMLPVHGDAGSVSAAEFAGFLRRHSEFAAITASEDNRQMTASYLMIDPVGRFFWTSEDAKSGYRHSRAIMEVGAAAALAECTISWPKFFDRYRWSA